MLAVNRFRVPIVGILALCLGLMAAAAKASGGLPSRRASSGAGSRLLAMSPDERAQQRVGGVTRRPSGETVTGAASPFSLDRAEGLVTRIQALSGTEAVIADREAAAQAAQLLPAFKDGLSAFASGAPCERETQALEAQQTILENLEGLALKGRRRSAIFRPERPVELTGGLLERARGEGSPEAPTKVNTGWILDQHLFDPEAVKDYPTLNYDYKHYDAGRNDMAMGHSVYYPDTSSMFGWVWQVQSFYWTDITTVPAHSAASYCLFIMVSPDGGFTWWLYGILYDPGGKDLVNPKMAIDITGTDDRYYIAYEYCYSASDHDVYAYGETSVLDDPGADPDPQDAGIATATAMEQNPAIVADYITGETSYRVVAYQSAVNSANHDLYAAQSTGNGSTWTAAVAVAADPGMECNPALTAGATGDDPYTAYVHLAYDYYNLLADPGFEDGAGDTAWYQSSSGGYDIIDSTASPGPRSGTWKAWLGGYNSGHDYLSQLITVPPDAVSPRLSFYLRITTNEPTPGTYDRLDVRVWDSTGPPGALLATLATYYDNNASAYSAYTLVSFDLSAYVGQTVRVGFEATTDSLYSTSFLVDDTAVSQAALAGSEVRYANAAHPGTAYPTGLAAAAKVTVLERYGTPPWPYGPPAVAATHGGSKSLAAGRVVVAADQFFPQDQPAAGDPARYQLTFAMNMCNGGTTCGNIAGCSPTLSMNWNAYYFDDDEADYRFPALVVDGVGWVQGESPYDQNGVDLFPEIFLSYYYRPLASVSPYGSAQMIVAFASDEGCDGFASGAWYLFTASTTASNDDNRVVPKQGTLTLFNYFFGWPGVCFNKNVWHPGTSYNDDVYFTTLGDNYTIDTWASGAHIDGYWWFYGLSWIGPWTYAWPAGYVWILTAEPGAESDGRYYAFTNWSTGDATLEGYIASDWCPYGGGCAATNVYAYYGGGCLTSQSEVAGVGIAKSGSNPLLSWSPPAVPGDVGQYAIYRAANASSSGQYSLIGTSATPSYTDTAASGPLYYYIVVAQCGPYSGPWGHYGQ
jgi:hypothetical protein